MRGIQYAVTDELNFGDHPPQHVIQPAEGRPGWQLVTAS